MACSKAQHPGWRWRARRNCGMEFSCIFYLWFASRLFSLLLFWHCFGSRDWSLWFCPLAFQHGMDGRRSGTGSGGHMGTTRRIGHSAVRMLFAFPVCLFVRCLFCCVANSVHIEACVARFVDRHATCSHQSRYCSSFHAFSSCS